MLCMPKCPKCEDEFVMLGTPDETYEPVQNTHTSAIRVDTPLEHGPEQCAEHLAESIAP